MEKSICLSYYSKLRASPNVIIQLLCWVLGGNNKISSSPKSGWLEFSNIGDTSVDLLIWKLPVVRFFQLSDIMKHRQQLQPTNFILFVEIHCLI